MGKNRHMLLFLKQNKQKRFYSNRLRFMYESWLCFSTFSGQTHFNMWVERRDIAKYATWMCVNTRILSCLPCDTCHDHTQETADMSFFCFFPIYFLSPAAACVVLISVNLSLLMCVVRDSCVFLYIHETLFMWSQPLPFALHAHNAL